ncbi:MAG: hypothetical protein J7L07_12805 [Candidatus Odinarchaeota archaeon]|nr:hypothetical protein [Candidatus Odinarchaeota archaeon]
MTLEGKGRLYRKNNRVYIYIPSKVVLDHAFPFKFEKGYVKVIIDPKKKQLIIKLIEEN